MLKSLSEIKDELDLLKNSIKIRLEYEKSFGIAFSRINTTLINEKKSTISEIIRPEINHEDIKLKSLGSLQKKVLQCELCALSKSRNNVVFGDGDQNANLMFIGEAPGYSEDIKGKPFVGKAGELLTKIINAIDLKREEVYIANILKCRPPENRNPNPNEITLCYPYLVKQIEIIKPKIICALGTFAAQTLLKRTESIGNLRGRFHDYHGINLIATYHPAYLLRNPNEKKKTWEDMKKVRDFLKNLKSS